LEYLEPDELERVISEAAKRSDRDHVLFTLLFRHGMRVSEAVGNKTRLQGTFSKRDRADERAVEFPGATVRETSRKSRRGRVTVYQVITPKPVLTGGLSAADFADGYIDVRRIKGSKRTVQELEGVSTRPLVEKYVREHPTGLLFPITRVQVFRLFRKFCLRAGIPRHKAHPHILKHTLGQSLRISGASMPEIQTVLGHASIASTGAYTAVGAKEANQAVKRMESRRDDASQVVSEQVESLGGIGVAEVLRRVLRQLEQGQKPKSAKKTGNRGSAARRDPLPSPSVG
jgi:hypothetical protein